MTFEHVGVTEEDLAWPTRAMIDAGCAVFNRPGNHGVREVFLAMDALRPSLDEGVREAALALDEAAMLLNQDGVLPATADEFRDRASDLLALLASGGGE